MGMSRDYKKPARAPAGKGGRPMLTGVMIGMFLGLAIALGVALFINHAPSPFLARSKPAASAESPAGQAPAAAVAPGNAGGSAATPQEKPRFDFYTILPGNEEPVTEQDLRRAAQQPAAKAAKGAYFLQAGAFQTEAEADNLKAKLALLGVEASIQTATLPDKGIWHRVRVGPYSQIDELNRVRSLLGQNGIKTSMVKLIDTGQANPR